MESTIVKSGSSGKQEFRLRSLHMEKRRIFITGEINAAMADQVIMQLIWLAREEDAPITIYLNSPGGEVTSGLAIYDILQQIPVEVEIVGVGMAASMAALILAGGQKGRRYLLPHSKVMIHEPYTIGGIGGSAGNIQNTAEEMLKTRNVFYEILARHTGKTIREVEEASGYDHYMNAEEAIAFGICDHVVDHLFPSEGICMD